MLIFQTLFMRNTDNKRKKIKNGYRLSVIGFFEHRIPNTEHRAGLTLIEIMVVVAILAIMSSTLFSLFQGSLFSQRRGTNKALVYSEARAALEMMSREIEKAMTDERKGIHYELWDFSDSCPYRSNSIADEFYFVAPINADNESNTDYIGDLSEIGYWLNGVSGDDEPDILMRHYTSEATDFVFSQPLGNPNISSDALIGNVKDLQFQYWNETTSQFDDPSYPTTSGYALPRAIKITLVMQYEIEKDESQQDTFITVVDIPGSGQ